LGSAAEGKAKAEANGSDYSWGDAAVDATAGILSSGVLQAAKKGVDDALSSAKKNAEEALSKRLDASRQMDESAEAALRARANGSRPSEATRTLMKQAQQKAAEASGPNMGLIRRLRTLRLSQWAGATAGGSVGAAVRKKTKE
jgi:hypothetical protein